MLVRWWLVDNECKRRMWLLYGWFNALMCCGSCFGAVAWAYQMQYLVAFYTPTGTLTSAENASLRAHADRSGAVFLVSYAIEFLCHSVAKLMVLNRLMRLSVPQGELLPESWTRGSKFVMAFVIVGNLVGLGSNVAAAVYSMQNADFASAASVAFAKNNTEEAMYFVGLTDEKFHVTLMSVSVQSFCEVAVLLLIISAFVLAGAMFASYASGMLRDLAWRPTAMLMLFAGLTNFRQCVAEAKPKGWQLSLCSWARNKIPGIVISSLVFGAILNLPMITGLSLSLKLQS